MSFTDELLTIPDFFNGKNIFITGGSGFVGKVLIEKLLRSCPKIGFIYVLMRPKRGKNVEERIKTITDLPLFDRLKQEIPENLTKIKLIEGDVTQLKLGISPPDWQTLQNNIHIIYHAAASVRFDDTLTDAIIQNTRGTREICLLALQMRKIETLVHISTTYCHTDRQIIGEQAYPAHTNWQEAIKLAETIDEHTMNILASKYMGPLPNTYTFAKSLAEHVVIDLCKDRIPSVIFRPSIVISSHREPFPGWIDNFNGPVGLMVASGVGIVRTIYSNPAIKSDYIPVDIVAKALIMAVWQKMCTKDPIERVQTTFYNGSKNDNQPITLNQIVNIAKTCCWEAPLPKSLWFPGGNITQHRSLHYIKVIFYHLIPALIIDTILKIAGYQPILLKIQRKIINATVALEYFITNEWVFINDNSIELETKLIAIDREAFSYHKEELDVFQYFRQALRGARKFLLKEPEETIPSSKVHFKRLWIIYWITKSLWYIFLIWLVFFKFDVAGWIFKKYYSVIEYFTID